MSFLYCYFEILIAALWDRSVSELLWCAFNGPFMFSVVCPQALQRTLEFEQELAERFGESGNSGHTDEESDEDNEGVTADGELTASAIRKKYQKQLAQKQVRRLVPCPVGTLETRPIFGFLVIAFKKSISCKDVAYECDTGPPFTSDCRYLSWLSQSFPVSSVHEWFISF